MDFKGEKFKEGQFIRMKNDCSGNIKGDIIKLRMSDNYLCAGKCTCSYLWEPVETIDMFDNADDYNAYCLDEAKKDKKEATQTNGMPTIDDLRSFLGMGDEDDDDEENQEDVLFEDMYADY